MPDLQAIRDGVNDSPYESLARAKAILRESSERALLERRRKEKQRRLQSSMLEYTEHARRVRKAHVELQARGGTRGPAVVGRLGAAAKAGKDRSPLRASDSALRRLYGNLTDSETKALEERYLPEILQADKHSNRSTRSYPGKRRGEGADFWDIVTQDGTVKRIVILRTDDQFVHLRQSKPPRGTDEDGSLQALQRPAGGLVSYRSDGSEESSKNPDVDLELLSKLPSVNIQEESKDSGNRSYHPGILPRTRPAGEVPQTKKPRIKIEVSLPRIEMDTPSPEPSDSEEESEEANSCQRQDRVSQELEIERKNSTISLNNSYIVSMPKGAYRSDTNVPRVSNQLNVSTHTFPIGPPVEEKAHYIPPQKLSSLQELPSPGPEVSQSSLKLGDNLAYHRAFSVNTSVQSLPTRMEGILKNAMNSTQRDQSHAGLSTESPRGTDQTTSTASSSRAGVTCRHGHIAMNCSTCRTVDEIQRRLKSDFRQQMRQTFQWNLQAGAALSNSARLAGRGKSNLVPHLREMWARKKKTNTEPKRKLTGTRPGLKKTPRAPDNFLGRSCEHSILKASTDSLRRKKSVRFAEDNVYHPMKGYHPTGDPGKIVSAS